MADNYVNKDNLKQTLEKLKGEIDKKGGTPHFKGTTAEVLAHYGISSLDDIPEGNITTVTDIEPESGDITADKIDYIAPYKDEEEVSNVKEGLDYLFKGEFWDVDNQIHKVTKEYMYYKNDEYSDPFYKKSSIYIRSRNNNVLCKQTDTRSPGQTGTQIAPSYKRDNGYMDAQGHYYIGEFTIYRFDLPESNKYYTFYTLAGTDDLIIYLDMPLSMKIDNKQDAATAITTDNISQQSVAHAATADTATDDTKLPLTGGTITGDIKPDETGKYYIGTADNAFAGVYARTIASRLNGGTYGSINVATEGTETTTGACRLTVGNSAASGTDKNAYGEIRLFNTGTNYVGLRTSNDLTANRTIYFPATSGTKTLAIDDEATTTAKGLMSAADKTKLNGIDAEANKVTITTSGSGNAVTGISATKGEITVSKGNLAARTGSASYDFNCKNLTVAGGTISVKNGDYIGYISQQGNQHILIKASSENYSVEFGVMDNGSSTNKAWSFYPNTSDIVLGTASKRWGQIYSTKSTIATSDREEKKNITIIDKAKEFIMKLKPVSYMFNNTTSDRHHYGFIAQDVEEAMNELDMTSLDFGGLCKDLKEGSDDEYIYGLRYEEFIAPLVATVQQQQKEIDGLKAEIEALKQNNINAM